jgi:hypothetical protein
MEMPSYLNYGSMLEMNPFAAYQANQQVDLAKQFQDQKYQQEQNTTNKGTLENIFSAQDNPNRVQNRVLQNEGQGLLNENQGYKNLTGKLEAERAEANQQNILSADQRAAALKMTEDDMKKFDYHVNDLLRDPDPAQRAEGAKLQTYLSSYQLERRKAADDLLKTQTMAEASKYRADNSLEGIKYRTDNQKGKGGSSLSFSMQLGKMKVPEQLTALQGALTTGIDPDTGAEMSPMAKQGYQAMYDQGVQQLNANNAARGQGQGMTLGAGSNGTPTLVPKQIPSVGTGNKPKLSDQELINQYLNKK